MVPSPIPASFDPTTREWFENTSVKEGFALKDSSQEFSESSSLGLGWLGLVVFFHDRASVYFEMS